MLEVWLRERAGADGDPLFTTNRRTRLSRDALEHIVRKHTVAASRVCPSLIGKRVSPHVLRHSTAMELLHHGVDQSVIALWLGHEGIETMQVSSTPICASRKRRSHVSPSPHPSPPDTMRTTNFSRSSNRSDNAAGPRWNGL
jgi:site-specific recombinase XerD